jgi:hypothetical protein
MDIVGGWIVGLLIGVVLVFCVAKPAASCITAGGLPVAGLGRVVCLNASAEMTSLPPKEKQKD